MAFKVLELNTVSNCSHDTYFREWRLWHIRNLVIRLAHWTSWLVMKNSVMWYDKRLILFIQSLGSAIPPHPQAFSVIRAMTKPHTRIFTLNDEDNHRWLHWMESAFVRAVRPSVCPFRCHYLDIHHVQFSITFHVPDSYLVHEHYR